MLLHTHDYSLLFFHLLFELLHHKMHLLNDQLVLHFLLLHMHSCQIAIFSETAYSVKLKNIKLNLSFALDMILGVGGVLEGSKLMLIFLVLDVLRTFFSNVTEKLEEKDAYLIYLIHKMDYRKTGVSKEALAEYIKKDSSVQEKKYFEKEEDLEESLKRLEDIQSIMLEGGCYHVTETILN